MAVETVRRVSTKDLWVSSLQWETFRPYFLNTHLYYTYTEQSRSVNRVISFLSGQRRFRMRFPADTEISLFPTASRPALQPTQPPVQWVQGAFSPEESSRGVKLAAHFCLVPKLRMHAALCAVLRTASWCDAQLNTETNLLPSYGLHFKWTTLYFFFFVLQSNVSK
jgi:hypothetical protein